MSEISAKGAFETDLLVAESESRASAKPHNSGGQIENT